VKRVLTGLLETTVAVRANPRSYNTEVGLPLAVLGLEIDTRRWTQIVRTLIAATWRAAAADFGASAPRLLLLELGARQSGDMAALLRTARPDWAVITPLGSEGDPALLDGLCAEMDVLATEVRTRCGSGRLLVAGDDLRLAALCSGTVAGGATTGEESAARLCNADLRAQPGGYTIQGERADYRLGSDIVGESGIFGVLAVVHLGERMGLSPELIQAYLARLTGLEPVPEGAAVLPQPTPRHSISPSVPA
jgi:UDP-N-acetylmuramyl pentapeptide synthase